jgi:hypothetical protein
MRSLSATAIFVVMSVSLLGTASPGLAQAPSVTDLFIFRDFRGVNDVGITLGDALMYGGEVTGGATGVTIKGVFTSNTSTGSFSTSTIPCLITFDPDPDFCSQSAGFNTARTNGTWQVVFTNSNGSTTFPLPSVSVIPATPVPFPIDVVLSADSSGTPTISWAIRPGTTVNAIRIAVYDKSQRNQLGQMQIIELTDIPPTQTSYTPKVALQTGGAYSISLKIAQTRDGTNSSNGTLVDILTRSSSFFSFTKPPGALQPVFIPQVRANGVYSFQVSAVGPSATTFIDPAVAVGYQYAIGQGDPNFASVTLPNVGGGNFVVAYPQGGQNVSVPVAAGVALSFPPGGVSTFSVTGINPGLDPSNAAAFVTGLTFTAPGSFTGTMTPIETGNTLFAATLPSSRSVQVGATATAFATILNNGTTTATGCGITPATFVPAEFSYQTTDPSTNLLTGTANTTVSIPPASAGSGNNLQTFLVAFQANQPMPPTNVALGFSCVNSDTVPTIVGVNSLLMTFDASPVPDVITVGLTPSNDGFARTGGPSGTGLFVTAATNIGVSAALTVRARPSDPAMALTTTVCQTNPNTGQCLSPAAPTATATINQNQNTTWSA